MFDFSTILRTLGGSLAGILVLVGGCLTAVAGTGCTFHMYGSGESGLGYRSESKVFAYHKAEEGNKAKASSSTELSQSADEWLFGKKEPDGPPDMQPVEVVHPDVVAPADTTKKPGITKATRP